MSKACCSEFQMRIAFFGSYQCFDYYHIGGCDSIARRLGAELAKRGVKVDFVHFNCPKEVVETTPEEITLRYFRTLEATLEHLSGRYDHILNFHVPFKQRLAWMRFRRQESKRTRFHIHIMFTGWHENPLTRLRTFEVTEREFLESAIPVIEDVEREEKEMSIYMEACKPGGR